MKEDRKQEIHPGFETQGRRHQFKIEFFLARLEPAYLLNEGNMGASNVASSSLNVDS